MVMARAPMPAAAAGSVGVVFSAVSAMENS
jgi:hypothetical protein